MCHYFPLYEFKVQKIIIIANHIGFMNEIFHFSTSYQCEKQPILF